MDREALLITLLLRLPFVLLNSQEPQYTIEVLPGTEQCFFETVLEEETISVEYEVLYTGGQYAMLDINFRLVDPTGIPVVAEFRKGEGSHSDNRMEGDYKICFDNKFSVSSSKVIFFEIILEREGDTDDDDLARVFRDGEQFGVKDEYEDNIKEIEDKVKKIKGYITKSAHLQTKIHLQLTKDKGVAENNIMQVDTLSLMLVGLMVVSSMVQVLVVKKLFNSK